MANSPNIQNLSYSYRKNNRLLLLFMLLALLANQGRAQNAAIKTNILSGASTSLNIGMEFALSQKWSLETTYQVNPWTFSDNKKWKHWMVTPELRHWLCSKFNGHFFGLHLLGGRYNIGNIDIDFKMLGTDFSQLKDHRFEGWFMGAGLGYGYSWILSKHWNLEAEIGFGYIFTEYDKFECDRCGKKLGASDHNYIGPTKAAFNLIYVF